MITALGASRPLIKSVGNKSFWCQTSGFLTKSITRFFPGPWAAYGSQSHREFTHSDLEWEGLEAQKEALQGL